MFQGPQDLPELLKTSAVPTVGPAGGTRNKVPQSGSSSASFQISQAPDTVQLSAKAVKAAEQAKLDAQVQAPVAKATAQPLPETPALRPVPAAPAVVKAAAALPAATEAAPAPAKSSSAPEPVAVSTVPAAVQAEPEVRPSQVSAAQQQLATLSGNSGAMDAKLAEKLLTES